MPHLAGRCVCGRKIHFPKSASLGHTWRCRQCGHVWMLSTYGRPLHQTGSRLGVGSSGCLILIVAGGLGLAAALWAGVGVGGQSV